MVFDRASRDLYIVEWDSVVCELLIIFVSLTGDQHDIARLCECDGATNRLCSIDNFLITIRMEAFFNLRDNHSRVLFAWIIGSDNRVIGVPIRHLAHQRTLLPVAVAAAAKNDDEPMGFKLAESLKNISQCVRCVRVVDENPKLPLCWNPFEPSRHLRSLAQAENRVPQADSQCVGGRQCCHRVCDVKSSD